MPYNSQTHHRQSIRLKNYDYSQDGMYFITICTQDKKCIFGNISDSEKGEMTYRLFRFGEIAKNEWFKTAEIRDNIKLDAFILMPNHLHGIIVIDNDYQYGKNTRDDNGRGTVLRAPTAVAVEQFGKPTPNTIPTIIRSYKATVTKQINILRNTPSESVWQRNYYEHIIRDEKAYNNIREYIECNPYNWEGDELFV